HPDRPDQQRPVQHDQRTRHRRLRGAERHQPATAPVGARRHGGDLRRRAPRLGLVELTLRRPPRRSAGHGEPAPRTAGGGYLDVLRRVARASAVKNRSPSAPNGLSCTMYVHVAVGRTRPASAIRQSGPVISASSNVATVRSSTSDSSLANAGTVARWYSSSG